MSIAAKFMLTHGDFSLAVDVSVPSQGVTSVFGPSGCGKTTLLRAIAGLERHAGGFLTVNGDTWQDDQWFLPPHKRSVGYVFQEASLFGHLDVRRNVEYGLKRVPANERRIATDRAVMLLGIARLLERKPHTLSGGERQRVAIARAVASSPRLLLMDEPLTALDRESKDEILPYLESLHDELDIPVIYVSHTLEETARLADHLVLMEAGRVVATGPVSDVLTRLDLPLAHGTDAEVVVDAVVTGHDEAYHLTSLDCDGNRFTVTRKPLDSGSHVRLRLAARDISITLERPAATSILNIFPATVSDVAPAGDGLVTARLAIGNTQILSRVTEKSAATLQLAPGKAVYAQIKSVALLG